MNISLDDLYPDATEKQKRDAELRLETYLRIVLSIAKKKRERLLDEAQSRPQDEARSNHYKP